MREKAARSDLSAFLFFFPHVDRRIKRELKCGFVRNPVLGSHNLFVPKWKAYEFNQSSHLHFSFFAEPYVLRTIFLLIR